MGERVSGCVAAGPPCETERDATVPSDVESTDVLLHEKSLYGGDQMGAVGYVG